MKYNRLPLDKLGISGSWEEHVNRGSRGQDFGWFDYQGEPVYAMNDGVVMQKDSNQSCGYYLWIKHEFNDYDLWSRYLHLKEASPYVNVGDRVTRGQKIANMGGTFGYATHLHFELWKVPKGWSFNWNDRNKYAVRGTDYVFAFDDQYISNESKKTIFRVLGTGKQVSRDKNKNQIEVVGNLLRCRNGAGTNQSVLGYIDFGVYNYTETKESGGYTWYNIGFGWIAGTKEDTKVYPKQEPKPEPTPMPTDDKDKKIKELEEEIKKLNTELLAQKKLIEEQNKKIDELIESNNNYSNLRVFVANKEGYYYIKLNKEEKVYF